MAKKKAKATKRSKREFSMPSRNFWILSLVLLVFVSLLFTLVSQDKDRDGETNDDQVAAPRVALPIETASPSGAVVTTAPYSSPTPIPPLYALNPNPSKDISMKVSTPGEGYSILALLTKSGIVVTDQSTKKYVWTIRDPNLADITPQSACTNGIQAPCPQDHLFIYAKQPGSTVITVEVMETSGTIQTITSTTFNLNISTP